MDKFADILSVLESVENDGRGIQCVKAIITYLRRGDWESAINVRRIDGDKTRMYPKVEAALLDIFGCRLHKNKNCKEWLCEKSES